MNAADLLPPGHLDREAQVADELERLMREQEELAALRERAVGDYGAAVEYRANLQNALPHLAARRARLERAKIYPARMIPRNLRGHGSISGCIEHAMTVIAVDYCLAQLPGIKADIEKELAGVETRIKEMEAAGAKTAAPKPQPPKKGR